MAVCSFPVLIVRQGPDSTAALRVRRACDDRRFVWRKLAGMQRRSRTRCPCGELQPRPSGPALASSPAASEATHVSRCQRVGGPFRSRTVPVLALGASLLLLAGCGAPRLSRIRRALGAASVGSGDTIPNPSQLRLASPELCGVPGTVTSAAPRPRAISCPLENRAVPGILDLGIPVEDHGHGNCPG